MPISWGGLGVNVAIYGIHGVSGIPERAPGPHSVGAREVCPYLMVGFLLSSYK